jgi:hypothetical protein
MIVAACISVFAAYSYGVPACHVAGLLHASITPDTLHPGTKFENLKVESQLCSTNIVQYAYSVFGSPIGLHISVPIYYVPRPDFTFSP